MKCQRVNTKALTNESVKEFSVTPTSQNNSLNYDAVIVVPHHFALNGIHVISVILIIFIILIILLLIDVSGKKCTGDLSLKVILKRLKISNPQNLILGHLNINYLRYKFECLKSLIDSNIDLLLISETKLNDSFPNSQFLMTGFHPPYRKHRTDRGGGLMFFIREDIPCREIMVTTEEHIEAIFLEINLRKRKWLLIGGYNPEKSKISNSLDFMLSVKILFS